MKIVCMKRKICFFMMMVIGFNSCSKQASINERWRIPDDPIIKTGPKPPPVPRISLSLTRCINSYQDLLDALGSNSTNVTAVVLGNGITIKPGGDLNTITYQATPETQANSLFDSRLVVEWRWPGGNWQLSTADVWSLGCVYTQAGQPPYTNLIRGSDTIVINTCFFWSTNEYTGERIDYLVVE